MFISTAIPLLAVALASSVQAAVEWSGSFNAYSTAASFDTCASLSPFIIFKLLSRSVSPIRVLVQPSRRVSMGKWYQICMKMTILIISL